ncbi:hypothetical protein FGG08_004539 [Glutinoglossum americanum]|uniref:Uncharacterized protein n=1 Tax=Glutinoglossum americanum TaxID=1670608 RepID=A0A9P8I7A8_9PEZI|nr:hypothetical protein FGG08_004539 [Glutinoglossum americanum]
MSSRTSYDSNRTASSGDSARSNPFSLFRRTTTKSLYMKEMLKAPEATESLGTELQSLEIQRRKGLDFAAFSPTAGFAAVAAGRKLKIFSWDRKADLRWTCCWAGTMLRECVKASERMVAIALSDSLVVVAAEDGFEVYELSTDEIETSEEKKPVMQVMGLSDLRAIALPPKTPKISGWICAGTGNGRLLIWGIRRGGGGEPQKELSLKGYNGTTLDIPSAMAFNHDGSRVCVGSRNRHIYIYELGGDGSSPPKLIELKGDFGTGTSRFIRFTAIAFLSENSIAITTDSRFPAGCPSVFDIERKTRIAFGGENETLDAQSLAVSPSEKRLVFVDSYRHRVILVKGSPQGRFNSGIAVKTRVTDLKHGSNLFIAALAFTHLKLEDGNIDEQEKILVMDRMGTIQLFSCNE